MSKILPNSKNCNHSKNQSSLFLISDIYIKYKEKVSKDINTKIVAYYPLESSVNIIQLFLYMNVYLCNKT